MRFQGRTVGDKLVFDVACPKCGCTRFEYRSLGVPGAGSSVCMKCRAPVTPWMHEPLRLDSARP